MERILVIQTAFIGDAILATAVLEKLHAHHPNAKLDFLVRKGNESLFAQHPFLNEVLVWDKSSGKYKSLFRLAKSIRANQYDAVINLHRFASSGFIAWRSKAKWRAGFNKNPFSFCYHHKAKHQIGNGKHETARNQLLIAPITDGQTAKPKLYPSEQDFEAVRPFGAMPYVTIAPASVWYTKQLPEEKWIELIKKIPAWQAVFLIGGTGDQPLCERIRNSVKDPNVHNTAGKFSLLQTAALMKSAVMNYVNDSAPQHIASAMDAPVTTFFCSTVPSFGFGPLSTNAKIVETTEALACRPCGLHGKKSCPKGHFKCGIGIDISAKK